MQSNSTTVYGLAYDLRNKLLANFDTREAAGSLTLIITTWAALTTAQARRVPCCELCGSPAVLVGEQLTCPECSPLPPAPAPALPRRPRVDVLVPSATDPRVTYFVRNLRACGCQGFKFRGRCRHLDQARRQRRAQIAALIVRARAALVA